MKFTDAFLRKVLLAGNYIKEADLKKAEEDSGNRRSSLLDYLLAEGFINQTILGQAIAESYKVIFADLNVNPPTKEQIVLINEETARKFRVVLYELKKAAEKSSFLKNAIAPFDLKSLKSKETEVVIATDNPDQADLHIELGKLFPEKKISLAFAFSEDIDKILSSYEKTIQTRFSAIIQSGTRIAPEILDTVFIDAVSLRASDIHFEPGVSDVLLRFRIDGVLHDVGRLPREYYENILNRIKVQSGIRLDEHYAAQDGAMQFRKDQTIIDLRVSVVPTVEGEKVVLRVLSLYVEGLNLGDLGFSPENQKFMEESADKPFGMILVVGPTGSGKTTTLYALLKMLNQSDVNITSIEDPVEYKMKGVNQIQVNLITNLTFAKGLRSIVRQDPDIILVGEIRDQETAEIAVNAALTGHLLMSTFHANDAATAIPRLLDMGIEPFLLASTLELVVAQRLVRKICTHCRYSVALSDEDIAKKYANLKTFFPNKSYTLYQANGCDVCGHSGYHGRTAIFEVIRVTPEMQNLTLKHPATQEIWKLAREQGSKTLFEDGIEKVKSGTTTLEELLRVAEAPQ
ncbi:MAG: GspE/PulE family protein [Patescibacteria group bacterium]